jgi:hypothetical protein
VAAVPDFITHYHLPDRQPFLNLSDLDETALTAVLADLHATATSGRSQRRFGPRYMRLRRATERLMRDRFIERGGRPTRRSPHYFVLGESPWFRGLYQDAAEIRIPLARLPSEQVSFTYPDSVTSMGLLAEFGIELPVRPHHGIVFRIEELRDVITRYGLPEGQEPVSYDGHQFEEFEHYIEVQVWTDEVAMTQEF